jgi:hypothetical protein
MSFYAGWHKQFYKSEPICEFKQNVYKLCWTYRSMCIKGFMWQIRYICDYLINVKNRHNIYTHKPLNIISLTAWRNLQANGAYITTLITTLHRHTYEPHSTHAAKRRARINPTTRNALKQWTATTRKTLGCQLLLIKGFDWCGILINNKLAF